jgi:hypothetical protein
MMGKGECCVAPFSLSFLQLYEKFAPWQKLGSVLHVFCCPIFPTAITMLMTKFLLAVMLLVSLLKVVCNGDVFANKNQLSNLILHEEEGKKEKGSQGKSKYDHEDKVCPRYLSFPEMPDFSTSSNLLLAEDTYLAFVNRPTTPPPNEL